MLAHIESELSLFNIRLDRKINVITSDYRNINFVVIIGRSTAVNCPRLLGELLNEACNRLD